MGRGGYCSRCLTAGAPEEAILGDSWYSVTIHEFAHAFHEEGLNTTDPTFDDRLRKTYDRAIAQGLWKNTYASMNRSEYGRKVSELGFTQIQIISLLRHGGI